MKETNLQIIREAVMEAADPTRWQRSSDIHISDVLLAMDSKGLIAGDYAVETDGTFLKRHPQKGMTDEYWGYQKESWNLRKDSLEEQESATLQFLADLLATK